MNTNFEALWILLISFFAFTNSASGNAMSSPSFAAAQRYLRASAPCSFTTSLGDIPLPLDFDILLPSFANIKPLIIISFHGFRLWCNWDLTNELKSQKLIMSWPFLRTLNGLSFILL